MKRSTYIATSGLKTARAHCKFSRTAVTDGFHPCSLTTHPPWQVTLRIGETTQETAGLGVASPGSRKITGH